MVLSSYAKRIASSYRLTTTHTEAGMMGYVNCKYYVDTNLVYQELLKELNSKYVDMTGIKPEEVKLCHNQPKTGGLGGLYDNETISKYVLTINNIDYYVDKSSRMDIIYENQ